MDRSEVIPEPLSFEWDTGNSEKNWRKHQVSTQEAEEAFLDERRLIADDRPHSHHEPRFILLGRTRAGRVLYIAFTIRQQRVRVISARSINRKEMTHYEKTARAA